MHLTLPKLHLLCPATLRVRFAALLLTQAGEEVHLEGVGQFCRGPEREIDVVGENLGDVWPRHVHPPGELGLADAQLLHAAKNAAEERRAYPVNRLHGTLGE